MSDMRDDKRTESDMRADDVRTDKDTRTEKEMRDERRTAERRPKESADAMRTNPEVMGRAEPVAVDDRERPATEPRTVGRVGGPGEVRPTNGGIDLWPELTKFHSRFQEIQSEFIDDPKSAVQKAETLMGEMLDHMRESMTTMHRDIEAKTDTEHLRLVMRQFRDFIDSLGHRQAA
jgi:hypothetical protein